MMTCYSWGDLMTYNVRAVNRALALLRCFRHDTPERGLAELAECAHLSKSTALRLLATLEADRFIEHDSATGLYRLGIVCIELGMTALEHMGLRNAALSRLGILRDETQETVSLTVMEGGEVMYVDVLESPQPVKIVAKPGRRLPSHCTATGKVFLAFSTPEEIEEVLSRDLKCYTPNTVCDPALLREEFRLIRERGFSVSMEQFELGIAAVAAPVWNKNGELAAAVGLPGPSYRISNERALELGAAVRATANAISRQLGATLNNIPSSTVATDPDQGV
jgi:DNA-binding IclR family transcriptional regulator